jgi:hypothetical protein
MPDNTPSRSRWRLQFSLAALFGLMTLTAIGSWYWYQRPFEVENKVSNLTDPFGPPVAASWTHREVETVRRIWGGKTLRHGPRRVYDNQGNQLTLESFRHGEKHGPFINYTSKGAKSSEQTYSRGKRHGPNLRWDSQGTLIAEENYANDVRHGRFLIRHADGSLAIEAAYHQGFPQGTWSWFPRPQKSTSNTSGTIVGEWKNAHPSGHWKWSDAEGNVYLAVEFQDGHIARSPQLPVHPQALEGAVYAAGENPQLLLFLFRPVNLEFADVSLKDAMLQCIKSANVPIRIDLRSLAEAGISSNQSISSQISEAPLLVGLSKMLRPYSLDCDFRYGMLCIDAASSLAKWKDATGVAQIVPPPGSRLAEQWARSTMVDVVEMPLQDVALYLQEVHKVRFDISLMPTVQKPGSSVATFDSPITASLRGITFKDALATILDQLHCKASLHGEIIVIEPR